MLMPTPWTNHRLPVALLMLATLAARAAPIVRNGSFEDDGTDIKGVGYTHQGNRISHWTLARGGEAARNTLGMAFHDNGAIPDGEVICALQNRSQLTQRVSGLERNTTYRFALRVTGRAWDLSSYGASGALLVRLNGTVLFGPETVQPVAGMREFQVPFRAVSVFFRCGTGDMDLELIQASDTHGVSVLVDDIRIEPAGDVPPEANITQVNQAVQRFATRKLTEANFREAVWIWSPETDCPPPDAQPGPRWFRRSFALPRPGEVARAFIVATADNSADFYVNGKPCGTAPGFSAFYDMEATPFLVPGTNVLAVRGANAGDTANPAALAAMLIVVDQAGKTVLTVPTGSDWSCATTDPGKDWHSVGLDDSGWERVRVVGPIGMPPWGEVGFLNQQPPEQFPEFRVPGHEREMALLRQLHYLHYRPAGPLATMWEMWMSQSTLWQSLGTDPGGETMRSRWRRALHGRRIDSEGYVSTHQHHGFGHGEGWPFPTSHQARGAAWQFAPKVCAYPVPQADADQWTTEGMDVLGLDATSGWRLRITGAGAALTSPPVRIDHFVAPFIRLEWQCEGFEPADTAWLEWTREGDDGFTPDARLSFSPWRPGPGWRYSHVPLYRSPEWRGTLTRFRFRFPNAAGAALAIQGVCTAVDTRHPINNACYLQGCTEYVRWTGDTAFLASEIGRMRQALSYALREFQVAERKHVFVPWIGHCGRSGLTRTEDDGKEVHHGRGIGGNYWDLLPGGGSDGFATLYFIDALGRMADLERTAERHPEWRIPPAPKDLAPERITALRESVVAHARDLFWNADTGRFALCVDTDGVRHDYGYSSFNTETIYYGLASSAQARSILDWLSGKRTVAGDTSVGDDIYHFRFGPRASTRRNIEWYTFVWSHPEGIAWGGQVQDGGAVLGFSFHDMMARLMVNGPDDAWARLRTLLRWFGDVQAEGGYREYYRDPSRGTLQGGGPPGGLGMDREFFESVLVPQIMLYGFLGIQPLTDALRIDPRLPSDWPELTVTGIRYRDTVYDITARTSDVVLHCREASEESITLAMPVGWKLVGEGKAATKPEGPHPEGWTPHHIRPAPGATFAFRR